MGLFDRLRGSRQPEAKVAGSAAEANVSKKDDAFFLDADASTSLGDVNFMRRSNTIRHTFPGTATSPGNKEMVAEVASMEAKLEKMSPGLAGLPLEDDNDVRVVGGVPKPVKKTFAQQMTAAELENRLKGSAVAVNVPGGAAALKKKREEEEAARAAQGGSSAANQAGAIDPFRQMAKDLNS